jgi:hypothetical protein
MKPIPKYPQALPVRPMSRLMHYSILVVLERGPATAGRLRQLIPQRVKVSARAQPRLGEIDAKDTVDEALRQLQRCAHVARSGRYWQIAPRGADRLRCYPEFADKVRKEISVA